MDQEPYAKQHDYISRMAEVPTKLVTLNKELDLLLHHAADIEAKVQMLDDMILKTRDLERRLGAIQYFLADDEEPIPGNPRDENSTPFTSNVTFETDRVVIHADYPVMNAPGKYGQRL